MTIVMIVSYKFQVNGVHTRVVQAKRGLRQRDPLSPLLFVLIMEYMNRLLNKLKKIPNFNFHSKCEKMGLTYLNFADDVLQFTRGDHQSVQLVMQMFDEFSKSTGLIVNQAKCKVYFGNMQAKSEQMIQNTNGFIACCLSFMYLGIPLTSKKLNITHYLPLIEKIVGRITHSSSRLLTFGGRTQLIKSVLFALTNYLLKCLPLP